MPGVVTEVAAQLAPPAAPAIQDAQPSRLDGPELVVHFSTALEMIRSAFDRFKDKLAVATMYQPSNYLKDLFDDSVSKLEFDPSRDYLRWTYDQVRHAGEMLAAALAKKGVREGMTIAFFARPTTEFEVILYASQVLKCRFSPMNPQSANNTDEVHHMLKTVQADVVIHLDDAAVASLDTRASDIMSQITLSVALERKMDHAPTELKAPFVYFDDLILSSLPVSEAKSTLERFEALTTGPLDTVLILFTSGTTSLPKACPLTNSILTSIATAFGNGPTGGPTAVFCSHLPMYHIAGAISAGWNPLTTGTTIVHPASSFTPKASLDSMKLEGITYMILVPTMLSLMLNDPALPPPEELSIRCMSLGASTILYSDVEKCYEFLGCKRMITSYGMTEGLMMTRGFLPREATEEAVNGIQRICAGARLKVCYPNTQIVVPRGEAGEVHQSGACTIRGYIGRESDNFYEDDEGVWCMTGDQAVMHADGGLQITGRYKDLIIRGGVNISPSAIEAVIQKMLGIESQVVGMPDSIAGEVPVAIIRGSDAGEASTTKLREPIIKELGPRFALEKFITLQELGLEDFPRTATGKIRKVDLQASVKQYAINKSQPKAGSGGQKSDKDCLTRVLETWAEVANISLEDVTPETSVHDLADSLMLARYATVIRESFGVPFTLQDLADFGTLKQQAELLEERTSTDSSNADLIDKRAGPPSTDDMAHVEEDENLVSWTRETVEKMLNPMGFQWEDVQDVLTPSQWLQSWVKSRETSDKFRGAYIAQEADVPTFMKAFKETLERNDSLRAISIPRGDGSDLQAILRYSDKWISKVIIVREEPVKTIKDLHNLIPGDTRLNNGLIQVVVAPVEETGTAGACLMTLHTTFDAFSLDIMRKDLNLLLNGKKPKQHVPYKLWADHLYNERESAQAKASVAFNVKRLHGLNTKLNALWPPQRAPVWQRGCDLGLHVTPEGEMTTPDDPHQRRLLDGPAEKCIGSTGILRKQVLQDMAILTKDHQIPPPIIVKAALSLLESRLTGESNALFSQTFAMRDNWPFIDEWMSRRLPSPLEVTGPTLSRIAEIIPIKSDQVIMDWLHSLKSEQEKLIKHAHAPYREVYDQLNEKSGPPTPISGAQTPISGARTPLSGPTRATGLPEPRVANLHGLTNGYDSSDEHVPNAFSQDHLQKFEGFRNTSVSSDVQLKVNGVDHEDLAPPTAEIRVEDTTVDSLTAEPTEIKVEDTTTNSLTAEPTEIQTDDKISPDALSASLNANKSRNNSFSTDRSDFFLKAHSKRADSISSESSGVSSGYLASARDGEVMESIRQRINLQWLPIFKNDKKVKSQVRFVGNSHFNEVGLAIKSGLLEDQKTIWIKMEWDDGNISSEETTAWINEMSKYVELLGKEENWSKTVEDLWQLAQA